MDTKTINNEDKKRSKLALLLRMIIGVIVIVCVLFLLLSIFSTEDRVYSLNAFLVNGYGYFLLLRLAIYGAVIFMCIKMKPKIKPTPYYKTFIRTSIACSLFVLFNEVMLYIRLMG